MNAAQARPHLRAPQTVAALELLADGGWHNRDDILDTMAAAVPPAVAYRAGEADRLRPSKRPPNGVARVRGDDNTSIAAGARHIARRSLRTLLKRGTLEHDPALGYRLTPA